MIKLAKNPDAMTVGGDEDTYKLLIESNKDLDFVQKGLNDYLETKRLAFPRWIFCHLSGSVIVSPIFRFQDE